MGNVGTAATLSIEGTNIPLDGPYQIWWKRTPDFDTGGYTVLAEGEVDPGKEAVSVTFTIPDAIYGINFIAFHREYSPEDLSIKVMYRVLPDIDITPDSARPGSTVAVRCSGFPAGNGGSLLFDGEDTASVIEIGGRGSGTLEFNVPEIPAGEYGFVARIPNVYTGSPSATLNVIPDIDIDTDEPDIGDKVIINGCGFAAGSRVQITYDEVTVLDLSEIGNDGTFTGAFTIPETAPEDHTVLVEDSDGNSASLVLPLEHRPPEAPVTVQPNGERYGMFGMQDITFTWEEVRDPSGITYNLEIADNLNFFPLRPDLRRYGLKGTSCTVTLSPGRYFWRVKAVDGAGNESEWALSPFSFEVGILPK
jgi:hypothetical protein